MSCRTDAREEHVPECESTASPWRKLDLLWTRAWSSMRSKLATGAERPQNESTMSRRRKFVLLWKRMWVSLRFRSNTAADTRVERPQHDPAVSSLNNLTNNTTLTLDIFDSIPRQGQDEEEAHNLEVQPQNGPSFLQPATPTGKIEEMIITNIRVTDVALGLRRIPAGFYVVVHHSGLEWKTENKPSSANSDIVEWTEPIPIPSASSATVRFEVYAPFELQPMLCAGEWLRQLTITVEQLLKYSAKDSAFHLCPNEEDVVSPCSSISVTVSRRKPRSSSSSVPVLHPHCSTADARGELGDATNDGQNALSRYRKHGKEQDMLRAIEEFERVLSACPLDHPCLAATQSNLAMAKFIQCRLEGTDPLLPVALYRNALDARPIGHVDRPATLIQLAAVHFARFEKSRDEAKGAQAEELLHEAVELSSVESHEKRAATFMLQLLAQRDGRSSVEQNSPSRLTVKDLRILSDQLLHRFERLGDLADLKQAATVLKELFTTISEPDNRYLARLGDLNEALLRRFNNLQPSNLEDAISTFKDVVDLIPHGHSERPRHLYNLAHSFLARFERLGELSDLQETISTLGDVVNLTSRDDPHKPVRLNNLANSFKARFERLGELNDLTVAISTFRDAVDRISNDDHHKPGFLNNLGNSLVTRFERLGEPTDLQDAILAFRDAVNLTPDGRHGKADVLDNLSTSLKTRFGRLGELSDLEDSISTLRDAVNLTPHDHPVKHTRLNNLGNSFITRFNRIGKLGDLEDSISMLKDAVDLVPDGHPDRPTCLNNLGSSLLIRFRRLGELSDLNDATSMFRDAVDSTPHNHHSRLSRLSNLGGCFFSRFHRLGGLSDLESAISTLREAVDLAPRNHPKKLGALNNLGTSLRMRFERLGQLSDLQDAISILKDAVDLTPHGDPNKPTRLMNLGNSFFNRFERLGEQSDIDDAISIQRDAVDLTPHGHPEKPARLNNLGNSLRARFENLRELRDLEDAISTLRDTVDLTPDDDPRKPGHLNNLGNSLRTRFDYLGKLDDLEDAISVLRNAADFLPHDHPHKSIHLSNLGLALVARFERVEEPSDIEDAIVRQKDAVSLTPHGHAEKVGYLYNLGNSYKIRFEHNKEPSDLEDAIALYCHVASAPFGRFRIRFYASQKWIACARRVKHHSLLHAYSVAINLLPQVAWLGFSFSKRYSELTQGADVVREAAAAALDSGLPETAVEWLEQGRWILWGELFHLRGSYEELASAYPDHAYRLRELSTALEHASVSREKSLSALSDSSQSAAHYPSEPLKQEAEALRTLAMERDKLLQEIRRLSGFENFLLRKDFSQLRALTHAGPVVILNTAESRCDALIVLANVDHVIHVPLPNFTLKRSAGLQNVLKTCFRRAREGRPAKWDDISWEYILSTLWECIVKPILDALAFSIPGDFTRIFWCPTGPLVFLPIHAAGFYDGPQNLQLGYKVFDFVVSSYVPALAVLSPPLNLVVAPDDNFRLLFVRQPPSDGLPQLPGVVTELEHIREVVKNSLSARTTLLESSVGTVEEVTSLMGEANWVHFACHGIQDDVNSGLCLADERRLKLRDIIAISRPRGGLAFLSACQTATGEQDLTEEAIHIAAGMLFAGYGGVIGTMWSISDKLAPDVARDVYEQLFGDEKRPDYREAARALHEAIGRVRHGGNASFDEWIPFIHVGL